MYLHIANLPFEMDNISKWQMSWDLLFDWFLRIPNTNTHTHTRPVKASLLVVFHGPKNFVDVLSQTYTIYFHVSTVQHIEGYPAEFPYSSVWYNKITSPLWVVCHSPMSLSAASLGFISSKGNETASRRSSNAWKQGCSWRTSCGNPSQCLDWSGLDA